MSLPYDPRQSRDVLGTRSNLNRHLVRGISNYISETLANSTASNYNTDQFGPNHRIIYDGVAEIFAKIIIDLTDLEGDSSISDLRSEFLATKITSLVFEQEDTPITSDDYTLKQIILDTTKALVQGSESSVILDLLTKSAGGSEVEITQLSNHLISVTTSLLGYTNQGGSDYHRHLVLAPKTGYGSTLAPVGYRWGDELHQHDIVNGVVQEANGHTHTVDFGLPPQIINLQSNLRKLLKTTKPAHIKVGDISSVLGESISQPSDQMGIFNSDGHGGYTESFGTDFHFSLGNSYQENMRGARIGTYESVVYGYASGKSVRVFRSLVRKADRIQTRVETTDVNGDMVYEFQQYRQVIDLTEIRPEEGTYTYSFPRFSKTGIGAIDSAGYFTDLGVAGSIGVAFNDLPYLGDGEIVLLDGSAYFIEVRGRRKYYVRALELTLDNIGLTTGSVEVDFLEYSWTTRPPRKRVVKHILESSDVTPPKVVFKINLPIRKAYKGLPTISSDIVSLDGYSIFEYVPLTNQITIYGSIPVGTELSFLVPYGEGDYFNFSELNSQSFVLNAPRRATQETGAFSRTIYDTRINTYAGTQRGTFYGDKPNVGLFSTTPVTPQNTKYFSLKTEIARTHGLNNQYLGLGKFYLNRSDSIQSIPADRVSSFAVGRATVNNNKVPLYSFGFFPRDILEVSLISIEDGIETSTEIDYTLSKGVVYFEGLDNGSIIELQAISVKPLVSGLDWSSGSLILSEGQVPFDLFETGTLTTPSAEEIMSNPQGRILNTGEVDQDRKINQKVTTQIEGQAGEQVFYDDEVTRLELSGARYQNTNSVTQDRDRLYAPSLILNSSTSLVGEETQLVQSRNVVKDFVTFEFLQ